MNTKTNSNAGEDSPAPSCSAVPIWEKIPLIIPDDIPRLSPEGLTDKELETLLENPDLFLKWWVLAAGISATSPRNFEFTPDSLCYFAEAGQRLLALEPLRRKGIFEELVLPPIEDWVDGKSKIEIKLSEMGRRMMYPQNDQSEPHGPTQKL